MARQRTPARGTSLIEVMIALAILAVGLLAMWNLHMVGLTSTASGRRHTVAVALARELAAALERLRYDAPLLQATYSGQGSTSPPPSSALFGPLVQGDGSITSGAYAWDDGMSASVPGARTDAQLREKGDGAGYVRRWTVWDLVSSNPSAAGTNAGVKLVAVSVTWHDPPFARPREVLVYTYVLDPRAVVSGFMSGLSP
jgi:prepilin-type N-terminal cleavage/methylation domain-containing protein